MGKSPEELKRIRSEAGKKAAATRRANREAAAARQQQENKTNSTNWNWSWLPWALLGLFVIGMLLWHPWTVPTAPTATETPVVSSTEAPIIPTAAPTEPVATEAPVIATETPTEVPIVNQTDVMVPCESIQVSTDNGLTWIDSGLSLETEATFDIGKRVTWTNRSTLVPNKAYNEKLSPAELKTVENTWLDVRFNACNTEAVVFAHGFEMNKTVFDGGVLFSFKGEQTIRVKNGEIVLWYDTQHRDKDLGRIVDEIKIGNFDIHGPLAFSFADRLKDVKVIADFLATHPEAKIVILP